LHFTLSYISIYNIDGKSCLRSIFTSNALFPRIQRYGDINARGLYYVYRTYVQRQYTVRRTTL